MTSGDRTVVIAGGSGFLGSRLAPALVARGYRVTVLSRRSRSAAPAGVEFQTWDPANPGPWVETLEGAYGVVNLCGASIAGKRWSDERKRALTSSRTEPTAALAAAVAALQQPPRVIVQASGVGYYGTGEEPRTESAPPGNDFLAELAVAWESALGTPAVRSVIVRLGVVLDGAGGALPQMLLPFRLFVGGPVAGGDQWFSWVHVNDAVRAIRFALEREELSGPCNLAAPGAVRNREFAEAAGQVLHRPSFVPAPRWAFRLLLGEQATLLCNGQRAVPERLTAAGFSFTYPALRPALENIAYKAG